MTAHAHTPVKKAGDVVFQDLRAAKDLGERPISQCLVRSLLIEEANVAHEPRKCPLGGAVLVEIVYFDNLTADDTRAGGPRKARLA